MSRYNNIKTLLDIADNYNLETITELLLDEDTPTEELAEDIAFVVISMWSMVPEMRKQMFRERLTDEIVNVEIQSIIAGEFTNDTNCRNCGNAMWWVADEGWYHGTPHCTDPEPYMGSI
jgi:hypothetical protein